MEDLIEVGVDILNALQPTAANMDLQTIKEHLRVAGKSVRRNGYSGRDPFSSLDDVEQEVQRVITAAAHGGGYILAGAHNIQPDTSVEKVVKLFEFAKKYGTY